MAQSFTPTERFDAFQRVSTDAASRRAIRDGTLAAEVTYSVAIGEPEKVTADLGDEEDLRSLMLDVRKFFLQEEAANFNAVANLLYQRLQDSGLKDASVKNREAWNKVLKGDGVLVDEHQQPVRSEQMFHVMVYGGMFHDDATLLEQWNGLDEGFKAMYRAEVNVMVARCVDVAAHQARVIESALATGAIDLTV